MKIKTAEKHLKQAKIDFLKKLLINVNKIKKLGGETDHDVALLKSLIKTGKHTRYSIDDLKYGGQAAINALITAGIVLFVQYPESYDFLTDGDSSDHYVCVFL